MRFILDTPLAALIAVLLSHLWTIKWSINKQSRRRQSRKIWTTTTIATNSHVDSPASSVSSLSSQQQSCEGVGGAGDHINNNYKSHKAHNTPTQM